METLRIIYENIRAQSVAFSFLLLLTLDILVGLLHWSKANEQLAYIELQSKWFAFSSVILLGVNALVLIFILTGKL